MRREASAGNCLPELCCLVFYRIAPWNAVLSDSDVSVNLVLLQRILATLNNNVLHAGRRRGSEGGNSSASTEAGARDDERGPAGAPEHLGQHHGHAGRSGSKPWRGTVAGARCQP